MEGGRFNTGVTNRSGDRAAAAFPAAPRRAGVDRRRPTPVGRSVWMPLGTLYTSIHCLHTTSCRLSALTAAVEKNRTISCRYGAHVAAPMTLDRQLSERTDGRQPNDELAFMTGDRDRYARMIYRKLTRSRLLPMFNTFCQQKPIGLPLTRSRNLYKKNLRKKACIKIWHEIATHLLMCMPLRNCSLLCLLCCYGPPRSPT